MSLFHFVVPKRINERAFLQQAFSVTLDLLVKDEPTPPPAAVDTTNENTHSSVATAANTKEPRNSASAPAAARPLRPTLSSHEVGPGSLPFQIGALYMMYCLHGTQLFRSPSSIRVSAQGMMALVRLRWRLKAAGPLAADALAVLARLVLGGDGGGVLQPAAYTGPGTLAYVNSIIPQSVGVKNQKLLVEEEKRKEERDQAMAREAKAARLRASIGTAGVTVAAAIGPVPAGAVDAAADSPGNTVLPSEGPGSTQRVELEGLVAPQTKWGPRAREEGAINTVSGRIEGLSTAYEQYADALGRARSGSGSAASGGGGSTSGQQPPSGGKEQDGCYRNPAVDRREHFQRDLANILERSRRKTMLPEAYGLEQLALHPPPLPPGALPYFSPFQIHVSTLPELPARVAVKKSPPASAAAAAAAAREKKRGKQDGERVRQDRGGSAAMGGGRGDGRSVVRDHIAIVQKSLDDAERDHEGGDGADREDEEEDEDLQRQERASRRDNALNGSANRGTVRLPGGLGNSSTQGRKARGGGGRGGEGIEKHDPNLGDSDGASDAREDSAAVPTRPSKNPPRAAEQARGAQKGSGRGRNGVVRGSAVSTGKKPNRDRAKPSMAGVSMGTRTRMASSRPQTVDSSSSEEEGDDDPDMLASVQEHESFLADIAATVGAGPSGGGGGAENRKCNTQLVAPTTAPSGNRSRKDTQDVVPPATRGRGRSRKSPGPGTTSGSAKSKKPRVAATLSPRGGRAGGRAGGRGAGGGKARGGGRGGRVSVAAANEAPAKRRRNTPQQATRDAKRRRSGVGVGGRGEERDGREDSSEEESSGGEKEEEDKLAALERLADDFSAAANEPLTALSRRAAGRDPPRARSLSGGVGGGAGRQTGMKREAGSTVAGKSKRTATPKAKMKAASTAKSFFVTRSDKAPPSRPPPQRRASGRLSAATKPRGGRSSLTPPISSSRHVGAANGVSRTDTATDAINREGSSAPSASEATAARSSGTTAPTVAVSGAVSGAAGSLGSANKAAAIPPASSTQRPAAAATAAAAVDGGVTGGEFGDTSSDSEPDDDAGGGGRGSRKIACGGAGVVDGDGFAGGSVSCRGRARMKSTGSGGDQEEGRGKVRPKPFFLFSFPSPRGVFSLSIVTHMDLTCC